MDLTNGITQMQSQLKPDAFAGYQQGANAYATAEKHGQEIASNKIKNEQAKREQEIQIRLQKAIEESFDPATGQPDYDKMAANGHKYGITAQQMDYTIKHLKENWGAISEVAQQKQVVGSIAKSNWNTQTPKAPATETQVAPAVATAPPATVAPVVPEKAPAVIESTAKGVAAPTTPTKSEPVVDGSVDVTVAPTTTKAPEEGKMAPLASDLEPFTYTEPPVPQNTLYSNVNKMEVQDYGNMGGGSGDGLGSGLPSIVSTYTIPRNVYTDAKGKVQTYSQAELTANPSLDIAKSAESFFRGQTGDNTSAPDKVAQDYLGTVYSNSLSANGAPVPPPRPIVGTPAALDKWRQDMASWQNSNAKAIGKANQDVQEVKSLVAKGRFDLAEKILKTQESTIMIPTKDDKGVTKNVEYRAYNTKARDAVSSLNAIDPIADNLEHEIASLKKTPGDTTTLQTLIPTFARVMGARMNPGSQISMGNIDESKMSSMIEDGKHAGLSIGGALAAIAGWMMDKNAGKKSFLEYAKEYVTGSIKNISNTGIIEKMEAQLNASKRSSELYKEQNLIGYKSPLTGGSAPSGIPDPKANTEFTPKTGWYNMPTGTRFKMDPSDPNSLTGMVTEASTNDVTGESKASKVKLEDGTVYNVNEGDPESEDVELTPWNKTSPKGPVKPAKKGAKPAKAPAKKKVW